MSIEKFWWLIVIFDIQDTICVFRPQSDSLTYNIVCQASKWLTNINTNHIKTSATSPAWIVHLRLDLLQLTLKLKAECLGEAGGCLVLANVPLCGAGSQWWGFSLSLCCFGGMGNGAPWWTSIDTTINRYYIYYRWQVSWVFWNLPVFAREHPLSLYGWFSGQYLRISTSLLQLVRCESIAGTRNTVELIVGIATVPAASCPCVLVLLVFCTCCMS